MLDKTTLKNRILVLDGAMGTMIQRYNLTEEDFHKGLPENSHELKGNNECLNISHPEIIEEIHKEYIAAGADIIETNTFSANRISQKEYGTEALAYTLALEGARIARRAAGKRDSGIRQRGADLQVAEPGAGHQQSCRASVQFQGHGRGL